MLGRIADQLYWLGRYVERGEAMARLLDASQRMSLVSRTQEARQSVWESALEVAGAQDTYAQSVGEVTRDGVIRHLTFDADQPSSIQSCFRTARENARALRGTISAEMWDALNAAWLELRRMDPGRLSPDDISDFTDWVRARAHLVRGACDDTMLEDQSVAFVRVGRYLERSDNTARLLDSKYHVLLPTGDTVGGATDYYQWAALLRSLSAYRAYRKLYPDVITPFRVAELLVLRRELPRSMRSCFDFLTATLDLAAAGRAYECQRLAGEMHARLRFGRMEDIFREGLHEVLTDFIDRMIVLGNQIQRDFMMVP